MTEFVYILTNPAIPDLMNIGWTRKDIVKRIRELSNHPGVPAPFECFYCCEVEDGKGNQAEAEIHLKFKDLHFNSVSSFFRIDPEIVKIFIEKKWAKRDVTPDGDALAGSHQPYTHSRGHTKAPITTFSMLNIPIGSELTFDKDPTKVAKVVEDRKVEYRGRVDYLSTITQYIYKEEDAGFGRNWGVYRGTNHWSFEGENLTNRRKRLDSPSGRGGTTTDAITDKDTKTVTKFEQSRQSNYINEFKKLEFTTPIEGLINGKSVKKLNWNLIMLEVMELAAKSKRNVDRFSEIFGTNSFKEFVEDGSKYMYIKGANFFIRGKGAPTVGEILKKGGEELPYSVYVKYRWRQNTNYGRKDEIDEFKVNC